MAPFSTQNSTEWDTDLFFKNQWDISRKAESVFGVGPAWVHLRKDGKSSNVVAEELQGREERDADGAAHICS